MLNRRELIISAVSSPLLGYLPKIDIESKECKPLPLKNSAIIDDHIVMSLEDYQICVKYHLENLNQAILRVCPDVILNLLHSRITYQIDNHFIYGGIPLKEIQIHLCNYLKFVYNDKIKWLCFYDIDEFSCSI